MTLSDIELSLMPRATRSIVWCCLIKSFLHRLLRIVGAALGIVASIVEFVSLDYIVWPVDSYWRMIYGNKWFGQLEIKSCCFCGKTIDLGLEKEFTLSDLSEGLDLKAFEDQAKVGRYLQKYLDDNNINIEIFMTKPEKKG